MPRVETLDNLLYFRFWHFFQGQAPSRAIKYGRVVLSSNLLACSGPVGLMPNSSSMYPRHSTELTEYFTLEFRAILAQA